MEETESNPSVEAAEAEQEPAETEAVSKNIDVVEQSAPVFLQERDESLIAEAALAALEDDEKAQ